MAADAVAIEVENLVRRFGTIEALSGITLTIRRGEFFSLLGPSGCGKTTLLRIISGLEVPDAGVVRIDGTDMYAVPAHKRPVNTVFQSYALFPHLTVHDNVAFGLRMKKLARAEMARRVRQVMELVDIAALAKRRPAQLSGGQQQRVALARAIVNEPQVLLLDEPLGALDLQLRKQLQGELLTLQRRLGMTFVYVTHDQEEALVMSDRIAVMRQGKIEQMGTAAALYERPRTRFVSQFLGACNILSATVLCHTPSETIVSTPLGTLRLTCAPQPSAAWQRDTLTLAIRPEQVLLVEAKAMPEENCVTVRVQQRLYSGATTRYVLRAGAQELLSSAVNTTLGATGVAVGQDVVAYLPPAGLVVLED
jgi:spermidine/putrescine transport system ATP-binding protein